MADLRILSLGAGVQSSTLALMIEKGEIPMVDAGIFADVGAEPPNVIDWLQWLKTQVSYPIYIVQEGNLKKDLEQVVKGNLQKVPIPFFSLSDDGNKGMNRRQCTADYKIKPVTKKIRELLGVKKGEKVGKNVKVDLLMGISLDEVTRMKINPLKYINNTYPLIEKRLNRQDCLKWFKKNFNKEPPRSACTFCPFHNNSEWIRLKKDKKLWNEVISLEKAFHTNRSKIKEKTGIKDKIFFHRDCVPLDEVDLENKNQLNLFENECEGYCGN